MFGEKTQARVERFQKKHGLVVDGIVGKQTASAILGNRSASKLNTGSITVSQRARLRDGGRSRKRRSKILREEQEILLELSLRSLRGGVGGRKRDYERVGGGHGEKSGRFSKRDIAAIGKPGGKRMRDVSAMHAPTGDAGQGEAQGEREGGGRRVPGQRRASRARPSTYARVTRPARRGRRRGCNRASSGAAASGSGRASGRGRPGLGARSSRLAVAARRSART